MKNHHTKAIGATQGESLEAALDKENVEDQRKNIRQTVLALRAEFPRPYRLHKSSAICDALEEALKITCALTNTPPNRCTVAVYAAFEEEVQLDQFIRSAYEQNVSVAFPCMISDAWGCDGAPQQTMEMRLVDKDAYVTNSVPFLLNPLKRYTHDDPALAAFPYVPATELTLIVVPLVAFDSQRNRLGYGGGNYDRYLPQLDDSCRQIAVAFAEQEVPSIPTEDHDVPVAVLAR